MTKLLISITTVEEARVAIECGADIIDLKDPSQGALGALPLNTVAEVVAFVAMNGKPERKVTSATVGDLPMQPMLLLERVSALAETGVDIIKVGFFRRDDEAFDYRKCLDTLSPVAASGVLLVAVLFAEQDYPDDLIPAVREAGFYGVMLDTAVKNGATFLDYFSAEEIKDMAEKVQAQNLQFGLAGSLNLKHIAAVKESVPDYVGFRGGVCADYQRQSALDPDKLRMIRKAI